MQNKLARNNLICSKEDLDMLLQLQSYPQQANLDLNNINRSQEYNFWLSNNNRLLYVKYKIKKLKKFKKNYEQMFLLILVSVSTSFCSKQILLDSQKIQMNQNQGATVTYPNQQLQINNRNTIVKIKTSAPLSKNASVKELMTGKQYLFQVNKQASLPYADNVFYRNGNEIAEIDFRQLSRYPQYEHLVHTTTYNQLAPSQRSPQTLLTVNFAHYPNLLNQGVPLILKFYNARLTHNTQLLAAMDPYVKVLVGQGDKNIQKSWVSKTAKKGGKKPNFNGEVCSTVTLRNLNDVVRIQIWDDDMSKDDYVGGIQFLAYELLNRYEKIEAPLTYIKSNKTLDAGVLEMDVQAM